MASMASMDSSASTTPPARTDPQDSEDPYLWLEDVTGDEALDWVRARNEPTLARFRDPDFERMRTEALEVLDTDARIPYVVRRGSTSTTSGATLTTRAGCGGAPRWTATAPTPPSGTC